ncbi:MAG: hypothetical protein KGL36_00845 [Gammaproteobacteria bacterium]|nr:hypothetical protein [Gammaproteobacteria bacterium]
MRSAGVLLLIATAAGAFARPATGRDRQARVDRIGFFGGLGDIVSRRSSPVDRPVTLFLTEDGSVALLHLRWTGWGTELARATGRWSASDCTPSCASGRRTTGAARLTLSSPGSVFGHRVYRCFQIALTAQTWNRTRTCLRREGNFYVYAPTAESAAVPTISGHARPK